MENLKIGCESVNFHFHRVCNYSCKFCFHTKKTSYVLPIEDSLRGLEMLAKAGMKKVNFSGGEPFLQVDLLGRMVEFCKKDLKLQSVSIVSNGSKINEDFFKKYGEYVDILAVSCDSFNGTILKNIGRGGGEVHIRQMRKISDWCKAYKVQFKINTVVCSLNHLEDMNKEIKELNPVRWKVFQCLLIDGENINITESALRDATTMLVQKEDFDAFILRHQENNPVPENNEDMLNSYLILDEYMRFLNCRNGKKEPSKSILDVGVENALDESGFDEKAYLRRGGRYKWSKGGESELEF